MSFFQKMKDFFLGLSKNSRIAEEMNVVFRLPEDMAEYIKEWRDCYMALEYDRDKSKSGVASLIAGDLARQALSEFSCTYGAEAVPVFKESDNLEIRHNVEQAIALGGCVYRPYFDGKTVRGTWYAADRILPTQWEGRNLVGVVLLDYYVSGSASSTEVYTKLEAHGTDRTDGKYHIRTKLFKNFAYGDSITSFTGTEVPLSAVPEWAEIDPDVIIENPIAPTFVYFAFSAPNNKSLDSPLGVSIFKDALPWIRAFDEAFQAMIWENDTGKTKLFVSDTMIPRKILRVANGDGKQKPISMDDLDALERKLYKKMSTESGQELFERWAPELRFDSFITGMNFYLHMICLLCGLDPGQYVFDEKSYAVTAREIKSKQQRTYHTLTDIQCFMITPSVRKMARAIAQLQYLYGVQDAIPLTEEISIDFGDSILIDEETEMANAQLEVQTGLRSKKSYLMEYRHLTEEEADLELEQMKKDNESSMPRLFVEGA